MALLLFFIWGLLMRRPRVLLVSVCFVSSSSKGARFAVHCLTLKVNKKPGLVYPRGRTQKKEKLKRRASLCGILSNSVECLL